MRAGLTKGPSKGLYSLQQPSSTSLTFQGGEISYVYEIFVGYIGKLRKIDCILGKVL